MVEANGDSYLVPGMGSQFVAGDQFVSPDPMVFVYVTAIDSRVGTAALRIWDLPEGRLCNEDSKPRAYVIESGESAG
jgi:hypothetical protein